MFSDVDLRRMTLDENTGRRRDSNRDWQLTELSAGQRKTVISERAMTFVAREVGDLMEVGKIVGFNEGRFRQFQGSSAHPNSQISSMFSAWRCDMGTQATVKHSSGCYAKLT